MVPPQRVVHKDDRLYTLDRGDGRSVYGETMIVLDGYNYREWIPWRSKLCTLIKRIDLIFPKRGNVLYLGAAQGTTVSHISDILDEGTIFAVEFSETAFRKLSALASVRSNIIPILEDAFHPERFMSMVPAVDILYQDVSQKEQLKLFLLNAKIFLKKGGMGILMLKSRSVDVTARPTDIYEVVSRSLANEGFRVENRVELDPFQVDHSSFVLRKV